MAGGDAPSEMEHRSSAGAAIGVGFVDILFGLAVAPAFTATVSTPRAAHARWAQLVVAIAVITFSWIGFHRSRAFEPADVSFTRLSDLRLAVDIVIIGLYFALAINASSGNPEALTSQTALLAAVASLYLLWDVLGLAIDGAAPRALARSRMPGSAVLAAVFLALAAVYRWVWTPTGAAWVVGLGAAYVVALYLYRVQQQHAEESARGDEG